MDNVISLGDALAERGYTVGETDGTEYVSGFGYTLQSPTLDELAQLGFGSRDIVNLIEDRNKPESNAL
jgi:hypothetical protein